MNLAQLKHSVELMQSIAKNYPGRAHVDSDGFDALFVIKLCPWPRLHTPEHDAFELDIHLLKQYGWRVVRGEIDNYAYVELDTYSDERLRERQLKERNSTEAPTAVA